MCFCQYFSDLERKLFGLPSKFLSRGCQYGIPRVSKNILRKKVSSKKLLFHSSLEINENSSSSWSKLRSTCPLEHFEVNYFFSKNFFFSEITLNLLGIFSTKFRQSCQNCILRVPKNVCRKNRFFEKFFLFSFAENEQKIFGLLPGNFSRVVKTAFCLLIGTFSGKNFLNNISFFIFSGH